MEQSARDAPGSRRVVLPPRACPAPGSTRRVLRPGRRRAPVAQPLTPELAARSMLETVTWWARHRHRDPAPPNIDDAQAREIATVLVAGSLLTPASGDEPARSLAAALVVIAAACSRQRRVGARRHSGDATTPRRPPRVKSTPVSRAGLDAIASRYRAACKSPGAGVGLRTADGATHFALSGRFAPGVALGVDSQFLAGSVTKLFVADHRVPTDRRGRALTRRPRSIGTSRAGRTGIASRSRCCSATAAEWATSATISGSNCMRSCCPI